MFAIGDFATFTQVSVPALRLWDRLGVLEPARVDPRTGYRYYRADQALRVQQVVALRGLGFTRSPRSRRRSTTPRPGRP